PGAIDGDFGPRTAQKTMAFQAGHALVADGIVGPKTRAVAAGALPESAAASSISSSSAQPSFTAPPSGPVAAMHRRGRDEIVRAWQLVFPGSMPSLAELQIVGAVATLEGSYGRGTYRLLDHASGATIATTSDSNNWGAIQCGHGPPCGGDCFLTTDSDPKKRTADNPRGFFDWCYRRYPTPEHGAADLIKLLTVKRPGSHAAMKRGDVDAFSRDMYETHYYGGTSSNPETNIDRHAATVLRHATAIADSCAEPLAVRRGGPMPAGGPSGGAADDPFRCGGS
ncbi:MAG TPA: peptidoglycan-binding domain-containing protein, partial [Chloroflexota bacterium]|nr:peptidoglycan-binding domain-containing protein [Chloroflexota bacterium]